MHDQAHHAALKRVDDVAPSGVLSSAAVIEKHF